MDKIKPARLYIQKVCEKKFITIDDLKSQRYAGGLGDIKREVINTLYHQYKLTQKEIAHLFGKSENAIWMMLQKKSKQTQPVEPLKKSEGGHIDHEQINFANPPAAGELVMVGRQSSLKKPSSDDKKLFIIVDFKNHIDLYNFLIKSAETNFRKPEDHILYLINHERAGADEDKEVLSYGTG